MSLIEEIIGKCEEIEKASTFVKTLAGKANDSQWTTVDPGYTKLKEMAKIAAQTVVTKAQELEALIPSP